MELKGRTALVTGGSRGIGAGIVRRFTGEGAHVAFTYLHAAKEAEEVVHETGALAIQADSGDPDSVRTAVAQTVSAFGGLDILVNNSYYASMVPVGEHLIEDFDRAVAVNLRGAWVAIQAALSHMGTGGRIINIGSIFADRLPVGELGQVQAVYSMTKAGIAGLTRGLARDLGPRGITVNNIQPGVIKTGSLYPEIIDFMVSQTPVGSHGEPADIASVVAYLAGPESWFVNGATWNVDGGFAA
jgi:3-oxoacyl-[acyl-carrier protein] reductase